MKFWQRIFFGTLIIFLVVFDVSTFILASYAYRYNRQREVDGSVREQGVILSTVKNGVENVDRVYTDISNNLYRVSAIVKPQADYYQRQGVYMGVYQGDEEVFTNLSHVDATLLELGDGKVKKVLERKVDGKRHVFVASQVPGYPYLNFVYARDISQLDDFRTAVVRVFVIMNVAVFSILGVSIYLLVRHVTRPIADLNVTAAEIAGGAYDKRVSVRRKDELGELGESFNRMADSVEENVEGLVRVAEERQQFIDDLTHEMKTPLTAIMGYAEYLQKAKCPEEERVTALNHLHGAAARFKSLSDKLLELAFRRDGAVEWKKVEVASLFRDLEDAMYPILASRQLSLTTHTDLEYIDGDETLLSTVLTNLVENAARASREGCAIVVRACQDGNHPLVEVVDSGHGMEKEEVEKVTAPFYRVDKSRSRTFGGIGLGLSIVSRIISMHGAALLIESEPEKGTVVRIVFAERNE